MTYFRTEAGESLEGVSPRRVKSARSSRSKQVPSFLRPSRIKASSADLIKARNILANAKLPPKPASVESKEIVKRLVRKASTRKPADAAKLLKKAALVSPVEAKKEIAKKVKTGSDSQRRKMSHAVVHANIEFFGPEGAHNGLGFVDALMQAAADVGAQLGPHVVDAAGKATAGLVDQAGKNISKMIDDAAKGFNIPGARRAPRKASAGSTGVARAQAVMRLLESHGLKKGGTKVGYFTVKEVVSIANTRNPAEQKKKIDSLLARRKPKTRPTKTRRSKSRASSRLSAKESARKAALAMRSPFAEQKATPIMQQQIKRLPAPAPAPAPAPVAASCFPASAKVLTPRGYRPIASLREGDSVVSGKMRVETVTKKLSYGASEVFCVMLEGRSAPVRTTRHHTFLTKRGWLRADRMRVGDEMIGPNAGRVTGFAVQAAEPVYNLHTTGDHTFVVEGVVAHNFTELRALRTAWHQLFVDVGAVVHA